MKIAFTSKGKSWDSEVDPRFGRAEYFLIYDDEKEEMTIADNTDVANMAHGAGPQAVQNLYEYKPDVLITGNGPGGNAEVVLRKTGIDIFIGASGMNIKEAYESYNKNELEKF